tara:strand:- start:230 stop:754 length:525 start_codon:yes stop_codon:yes gene_type:complete
MDFELIMYATQMLTGLATFIVALVLIYELKQQHRDAQRELVLAINEQRQSLAIALANNPELSEINFRGGHDFADLKNQEERTRFFRIFSTEMNLSNIAEQYSDLLHVDPDFSLKVNLALFPGRRKFYKESMMKYTLPEKFVKKIDEYISEIENNVGEDGQDTSVLMDRINQNNL